MPRVSRDRFTEPPSPFGVRSYDELACRLGALRIWAAVPFRELHRELVRYRKARGIHELPAYDTVYRCMQAGRSRLDVELVVDIARVLLGDDARTAQWRQAWQCVATGAGDASIVSVDEVPPDDLREFTGRDAELGWLHDWLLNVLIRADRPAVSVIAGMAGVGKTRLAVRSVHRLVAQRHDIDARLWVNLRGFEPDRPPAAPAAVLDGLLRRLGVSGRDLAGLDLAAQHALLGEVLAGKRAVIVLDNAAGEDQLRPILPDSPSCAVLVTSRRRLSALPAARHLVLEPFTPQESVALLRRVAGAERFDAEPDTTARIVALVGQLPLAVAMAASRIAATPDWTLTDHADRFAERRRNLRLDDGLDVTLAVSYAELPAEHRRLLRMCGQHPGRNLDAYGAAAMLDSDLDTAERLLTDLLERNMLQQRIAGRFELHDLVRVFANARALDEDAAHDRRNTLTRLLDHYQDTAAVAMDLYAPHDRDRRPPVARPARATPALTDRESATAWLDVERANILAVAMYAADQGWPAHIGDLSTILTRYFDVGGHHHAAEILHTRASAMTTGAARGQALNSLGLTYWRSGRYPEAIENLQHALAEFRACRDRRSEGRAVGNLGILQARLGRYAEALELFRRACAIAEQQGNLVGEGPQRGNLGAIYVRLGRYQEATDCLRRALEISRTVGDRAGECRTLDHLGVLAIRQGRPAEALRLHGQALAISREIGDRSDEVDALSHLGTAHRWLGHRPTSLQQHRRAVALAREIDSQEGEAAALNDRGSSLHAFTLLDQSLQSHQRALDIATGLGDRYEIARAHDGVAAVCASRGDTGTASKHWQIALDLQTDLGTPEATEVAGRLRALEGQLTSGP